MQQAINIYCSTVWQKAAKNMHQVNFSVETAPDLQVWGPTYSITNQIFMRGRMNNYQANWKRSVHVLLEISLHAHTNTGSPCQTCIHSRQDIQKEETVIPHWLSQYWRLYQACHMFYNLKLFVIFVYSISSTSQTVYSRIISCKLPVYTM